MLEWTMLRSLISACSTLLGSIGVFFLTLSIVHPVFSPHALFFLSAACGIMLYVPK